MTDVMLPEEFCAGLLALAEGPYEKYQARLLGASYRTADLAARQDCTRMLREDLAGGRESGETS